MTDEKIKELVKCLIGRMLKDLPLDTVVQIVTDANESYYNNWKPPLPNVVFVGKPENKNFCSGEFSKTDKLYNGINEFLEILSNIFLE